MAGMTFLQLATPVNPAHPSGLLMLGAASPQDNGNKNLVADGLAQFIMWIVISVLYLLLCFYVILVLLRTVYYKHHLVSHQVYTALLQLSLFFLFVFLFAIVV